MISIGKLSKQWKNKDRGNDWEENWTKMFSFEWEFSSKGVRVLFFAYFDRFIGLNHCDVKNADDGNDGVQDAINVIASIRIPSSIFSSYSLRLLFHLSLLLCLSLIQLNSKLNSPSRWSSLFVFVLD